MFKAISNSNSMIGAGVRSMFLSTFFFAMANVCVKEVSHLPAMEIVFIRCLIGVLFCWYGLRRAGAGLAGSNRLLLFLRGAFGTTALFCFFVTVQNIPLASAMTIQYLSPIFTSVIAIFLLNEKVVARQWLFYAIAFAGVLFIQQFDTRVSPFYLGLGVVSAFGSGMAYNLVRSLKEREHPLTVVFHFQLIGMIAGGVMTVFSFTMPVGKDWIFLILIGIFSQLGQVFLTDALQKEKAASVAIIIYTGLIYGISIGWIVYGEAQTVFSIAGMMLVVAGVALSVFSGNRDRQIIEIESSKS